MEAAVIMINRSYIGMETWTRIAGLMLISLAACKVSNEIEVVKEMRDGKKI